MNERKVLTLHIVIAIFTTNFPFLHTSWDFSKQLIHFLATIYTLLLPNTLQFNSIQFHHSLSLSSSTSLPQLKEALNNRFHFPYIKWPSRSNPKTHTINLLVLELVICSKNFHSLFSSIHSFQPFSLALAHPHPLQAFLKAERKGKTMSRSNGSAPKLDLKLNLSPPRADRRGLESPTRSATPSPPSSCVSIELNQEGNNNLRYSNSPEATSMVLVGCPRCLMYVMLSEDDPKCPKCKSTVLLDFLHDNNINNNNKKRS